MNLLTTKTLEPVFLCLHIFVYFCFLGAYRDVLLEGCLLGGLYAWRAVSLFFFLCFSLSHVYVAGSTFFSLPDGLRHLCRDHNPYSILHIPYFMLYVIYDLEGSNDVNPQVRNLFHVFKIYLPFCLVH
jgi:hypothetical protein